MKRIISFITILAILCTVCPVYAANDISDIKVAAKDCINYSQLLPTDGTPIQLWTGNAAGYELDLPYQATEMELIINTGTGYRGALEIRLDSWNGPSIARIDTTQLTGEWINVKHTVKLAKPIFGKVSLWIYCEGVMHLIDGFTLNQIDPNAPVRTFSTPILPYAFPDISEDTDADRITLLADLGIISKDSAQFLPDSPITRKEYVKMIGKIIGAEKYSDGNIAFADVDTKSDDAAILSGLYNLGIIKGNPTGEFRPNSFITLQEAATVCANALGYSFAADTYIEAIGLANRLKLLVGVDTSGSYITKLGATRMIFNLLLTDYLNEKGISDDNIIYEPQKNFLEKYTPYIYGEGLVTGNYDTKLYFPETDNDAVTIDGKQFISGQSSAGSYIGVMCEFFYSEKDGKNIIHAIRPASGVTMKSIRSCADVSINTLSEKNFIYSENDKEYTCRFDSSTAFIYNGVSLDRTVNNLINPNKFVGNITLIDNDSDRIYDCVLIDEAQSIVVETIQGSLIKDKLSGKIIDTDDGIFDLFRDGEQLKVKLLKTGDVLTLYKSINKTGDKLTRAILTANTVLGTVSEVIDNGAVVIDDKEYIVDYNCKHTFKPGQYGEFYINEYGMIVSFEMSSAAEVGVFITSDNDKKLDGTLSAKILTPDGIKIYKFAENIKADGVSLKNKDQIYDGYGAFNGIGNLSENCVILYKLGSDGKVIMIDTEQQGAGGEDDTLTRLGEAERAYGAFNTLISVDRWMPVYAYENDARFITITEDGKEENYRIQTGFTHVTDTDPVKVVPYSSNKDSFVADILFADNYGVKESDKWKQPFIYERTSKKADNEGNTALCISGYSFGGPVSYIVDMEMYKNSADMRNIIASVRPGDIIWPKVVHDKVTEVELTYLYDGKDVNDSGINAAICSPNYATVSNKGGPNLSRTNVLAIEDNFIKVMSDGSISAGTNLEIPFSLGNLAVAVCNVSKDGKIEVEYGQPGTILFEDSKILVYDANYTIYGAFVYNIES